MFKKTLHIIIAGDFNIIRSPDEKNNDNYNDRWPFLFNAVIGTLNLRELDMAGRKFTWLITYRIRPLRNLTGF
jgi:hypothetical protein